LNSLASETSVEGGRRKTLSERVSHFDQLPFNAVTTCYIN
jgi:hypothetical protein